MIEVPKFSYSQLVLAKHNKEKYGQDKEDNCMDFGLYAKYRLGRLTEEDENLYISELRKNLTATIELVQVLEDELNKLNPVTYSYDEFVKLLAPSIYGEDK
jgi:hypothetical protein